jgi:hypothetical protein
MPVHRPRETERPHKVRGRIEESPALTRSLEDEVQPTVLEVPNTSMDESRRSRRRSGPEIVLLDENRPESPAGRVPRHARTDDSSADDRHIELRCGGRA